MHADTAEREAQLRGMGVAPEAIKAFLAQDAIDKGGDEIEVLEENWDAVRVYQLCHWDIQPFFAMSMGGGSSGFRHLGIATPEIASVALACDVRCNEDLLWRVRILAREARTVLNEG